MITDRLVSQVAQYNSDKYSLSDDLNNLEKVYATGAPEATILYCTRIMESLV